MRARAARVLDRLTLGAVCLASWTLAADEAPAWLRGAAQVPIPTFKRDVPAAVLLDEDRVSIDSDGRVTTERHCAVRILSKPGQSAAVGTAYYDTDSGKVKELRAWLIHPSGEVTRYGKERVIDVALVDNDVYSEARRRLVAAGDEAEVGSIFGYEAIVEERPLFAQLERPFQSRLPTLRSRLILSLPPGWRATSVTFNHAAIEPSVSGASTTWELRDLPFVEDEPRRPPVSDIAARLAVSYDDGGSGGKAGASFASWSEVSRWMSTLSDGQAQPDASLGAKARDLTKDARTDLERIRAIARYVQSIRYISIQIGIGRYRPHAATEVFAKSYGDCKDKANLMRAMLAAVGIEAQLVLIFSGDRNYVREEWASPAQFNHCIIAVKVKDVEAATVVSLSGLGRFLLFDPTNENTPVGDLPPDEQGSLALIVAGSAGQLVRTPTTPPEGNVLERSATVELSANGAIVARVEERAKGRAAVRERAAFKSLTPPEYMAMVERWVTQGATGAKVSKVAPEDGEARGVFQLNLEFGAADYAQLMQGRLLVFRPAVVSRRESLSLTAAARRYPVMLEASSFSEVARFELPAGFVVDETPDPVNIETPYGTYRAACEVQGGELLFKRTLVERVAKVPLDQYPAVRAFYEKVRAAEQAPVVLARK